MDYFVLPYLDNILASIAVCKSLNIIDKIKSNFFSNYKIPSGRGNIKKFNIGSKIVNIIEMVKSSRRASYITLPLMSYSSILIHTPYHIYPNRSKPTYDNPLDRPTYKILHHKPSHHTF